MAGPVVIAGKLQEAVQAGEITAQKARLLAGDVLFDLAQAHNVAKPSTLRRSRADRRELGLVLADGVLEEVEVDISTVLEAASRQTHGSDVARATDPLPSPPRVRVVVYLDADAIEDLELIRRYRHGPQSRSEVVRTAIGWLRAKEAAWLLGAHRNQERRRREAEQLALLQAEGREKWEKQALDVM